MNPGPKITVLSGVQGDTRRYRTFHLYEQLLLPGLDCRLSHITQPALGRALDGASVIVLHRVAWDRHSAALLEQARRQGALLVYDTDDLIFDPEAFRWIDSPDFQDKVRANLYRENMRRNRRMMEMCAAVLVSTNFLAREVQRQLHLPAHIHRNGYSLEMADIARRVLPQTRSNNGRVILGYASGTPTHDQDFALIRPALQQILAENPEVDLHIVGHLDPGTGWPSPNRVQWTPFVPWRRLPEVLAKFDVNLAPLRTDNPFSQSKSEIKFMEAALVGVPTTASPADAFRDAVHSGENGFLAATPAEWVQTLSGLVRDEGLRQTTARQAREEVLREYAPSRRAEQITTTLNVILKDTGHPVRLPPPPPPTDLESSRRTWVAPEIEKHPTLLERGVYSWKSRGVFTLLKEIWVYFRRMVAPVFPFQRG